MAYAQIDVSEVGQAELPLIRVLCESIFGSAADFPDLERIARDQPNAFLLIAHLEGNPLGHLVASARDGSFVVRSVGVLAEYQGLGIEQQMLERARGEAKRRGLVLFIVPDQSPRSDRFPSGPPSPRSS